MEQGFLTSIFLPAVLVLIMFGVGLELRGAEFVRVLRRPRGLIAGVLAQMVLVPLAAFAVASIFALPAELAVGIVVIGACPGGAVSNLISYLARADVALSVSLTAVSSMLTILTIPIIVNVAMEIWMDGAAVRLPLIWTSLKLTILTLIPVLVGMGIRHIRPEFAARAEPFVSRGSTVGLGLVIAVAVGSNIGRLPEYLTILWAPLILLNLATIVAGALVSIPSRSGTEERMTLMIESGIQNGVLGITIPAVWIGSAEMAIPPAIYGVLMLFSGLGLIFVSHSSRVRG